jgi:hypothetical protein
MRIIPVLLLLSLALPACGDDEPDYDCRLWYVHDGLRPFCDYQPGSWWHYRCGETGDTVRLEVTGRTTNLPLIQNGPGKECATTFSDGSTTENIEVGLSFSGAFQSYGQIAASQRSATQGASHFDLRLTSSNTANCAIKEVGFYRTIVFGFAPDGIIFTSSLYPNASVTNGIWNKDVTVTYQGVPAVASWFIECESDTVVALNRIHWSRTEGIVQFDLCGQTFHLQAHNIIR